jgi:N-methylhydantoinase A
MHVSVSHRLASVLGEYERTSTAVVNAWVAPTVERYMSELRSTLTRLGLRSPLLIVQASGGVVQAEDAVPVHTVESGPAAGMVAVRALAESIGERRVIATDVGGTTFKVGLLADGEWATARETIVNQYSLLVPMLDLVSIGAGGGSIAWVDDSRLRVGPDSAGGDPGPAAYGWGGTKATVTDADVVLGFVNPARFLGGRLVLDAEKARAAIVTEVADPLFDGDPVAAAAAIRRVVDAQMGDLIRKSTIEHGHDPRYFVLVAYGGAGPLHAADYARGLGVKRIVVPAAATAYSAYGAAASDVTATLQSSVPAEVADDPKRLDAAFADLERDGTAFLARQAVASDAQRLSRWADIRYVGQLHDVRVPLVDEAASKAALREAFERRYALLYGAAARLPTADLQVLRIGVDAVGAIAKPPTVTAALREERPARAPDEMRPVFWPRADEWIDTDVHDGPRLYPGDRIAGPAIVDQPGTTIVVPDAAVAAVDAAGNFIITLDAPK